MKTAEQINFSQVGHYKLIEREIMNAEQIRQYASTHPGIDARKIAANLRRHGMTVAQVRVALGQQPPAGSPMESKRRRASGAMTREQFAANFDSDTKTRAAIRGGVAKLGPDDVFSDSDFKRELCAGASSFNWKLIASEPEFKKNRWQHKGSVYWGAPETKRWAINGGVAGCSEVI